MKHQCFISIVFSINFAIRAEATLVCSFALITHLFVVVLQICTVTAQITDLEKEEDTVKLHCKEFHGTSLIIYIE